TPSCGDRRGDAIGRAAPGHRRGHSIAARGSTRSDSVPARCREDRTGATMPAMSVWKLQPVAVRAFGLTVAAEVATVGLSIGLGPWYGPLPSALFSVALAGAGLLIASQRPRNA